MKKVILCLMLVVVLSSLAIAEEVIPCCDAMHLETTRTDKMVLKEHYIDLITLGRCSYRHYTYTYIKSVQNVVQFGTSG